jgi:hypothetical protein
MPVRRGISETNPECEVVARGSPVSSHIEAAMEAIGDRNRMRVALLSACVPGLGQLKQGRIGTAVLQFGTVLAYLIGGFGLGSQRALLLALLWNVWSAIDAYRHEAK